MAGNGGALASNCLAAKLGHRIASLGAAAVECHVMTCHAIVVPFSGCQAAARCGEVTPGSVPPPFFSSSFRLGIVSW
jgi:hypothetical protein